MRLDVVRQKSAEVKLRNLTLPTEDRSLDDLKHFRLGLPRSTKRTLVDLVSPLLIRWNDSKARQSLGTALPFKASHVAIGHRYTGGAALSTLNRFLGNVSKSSVLIQGCWLGDQTVQYWLKRGAKEVCGIEIVNMTSCWNKTIPELEKFYGGHVEFKQGKVEAMPYRDESFDLISSCAVYEHVFKLDQATVEMARVLRRGGHFYHSIGPLYYCCGGDHCSADFAHLLDDDDKYRRFLKDDAYFNSISDPNCRNWAIEDIFSFATTEEYLGSFEKHFDIKYLLVVVSQAALSFRANHPQKWKQLIASGVAEHDLLVEGLHVIGRKR